MNIIMISTGTRPHMTNQAVDSLRENAHDWSAHTLTLVIDGNQATMGFAHLAPPASTVIINCKNQGASASRNIGASSIPSYRRQKHLMFLDDDVYMTPGWDSALRINDFEGIVLSGHAHPYNKPDATYEISGLGRVHSTKVLSTLHMVMHWEAWDDIGFFIEPGGPGGSEDVHWCARAIEKSYGLAVTDPMCVMHCGLTNSRGQHIVGYREMLAQNMMLMTRFPKLNGEVKFG